MANRYKEIIGSWVTLVGTIIAALGVTPAIVDGGFFLEDDMTDDQREEKADLLSDQLTFIGNAMQGLGNATESVGREYSIEKAGEIIQAAGNTTVLFAIDTIDDERKRVTFDITGNLLQSFGGLIIGLDELQEYEDDYYIDAIGNLLQSIGNAIQAVGGLVFLRSEIQEETTENNNNGESKENEVNSEDKRNKGKNGDEEDDGNKENEEIEKLSELIIYIGSWVQSGGAIVSAVATTQEVLRRIKEEGTIEVEDKPSECMEEDIVRKYGYGYY
ncbi:MAG: DUF6944 family repetitive protein [Bacillaceae bacterium]